MNEQNLGRKRQGHMIGIFDSGTGGMAVARSVTNALPGYDIVSFMDTARFPYHAKTGEEVFRYTMEGVDFLKNRGASVIIFACDTAFEKCSESLRRHGKVFDMVSPVVEAVPATGKPIIGVAGTRSVIDSGVYEKQILKRNPDAKVWQAACPLLTPLIEEGMLKKPEARMIVKKYLHPLKTRQVNRLILGSAHFSAAKKLVREKIGKRVVCIDAAETVAKHVRGWLEKHPDIDGTIGKNSRTEFFASNADSHMEKVAGILFGRKASIEYHRG